MSPTVTHCHPLPLTATHCHPYPLFTVSSPSLHPPFTLFISLFTSSSISLHPLSSYVIAFLHQSCDLVIDWSGRKSKPHVDRSDIIVFVIILDAASSQYAKILYFCPPSKIVKFLRSKFFVNFDDAPKARLSRDAQKAHLRCISCHLTQVLCQSAHAKR